MTDVDLGDRHPATTGLLRWFEYDHLPPHLQAVSRPVRDLAYATVAELPDGPELTTGLRKLLEAKDCFVRQAIDAVQTRSRVGSPREVLDDPDLDPEARRTILGDCLSMHPESHPTAPFRCELVAEHDGPHRRSGEVWA